MLKIRAGIGYDIHRTCKGDHITLGGTRIPAPFSLQGHSDADVLIHALIDSLLGASGGPDIGELYPDTKPELKGIASSDLLSDVLNRLQRKRLNIVNIDCVVVAENPNLSPHKTAIRNHLANLLGLPPEDVAVKAKSKEQLDAVGRGEAIECFCTCMVRVSD